MTLRADAQRNLDRVLEAAAECFAEQGCDVSIDEIARRAGVGHGTVFRRFPTKDALLEAVLGERVDELKALADQALTESGGFERFLRHAGAMYARDRALIEGIARCRETPQVEGLRASVRRLVRRAQADGELRKDVTGDDVLRLIPTASAYPAVILDGLRPVRQTPRRGS